MNNRIENKMVLFENSGAVGGSLDSNSILIAEFNYAAQTASQSNEDRVKIFQFVVANTLTIAATVVFSSLADGVQKPLLGLVFLVFVIFGVISLFQLSRLRLAWIDSVKSMNKIKDFYVSNNESLSDAFLWRTSTIPRADKGLSLAYLLALSLIFVNTVSIAISAQLFFASVGVSIAIGVIFFLVQSLVWNKILKLS